jgi:tetratricopeptide (TPR) repeat protein
MVKKDVAFIFILIIILFGLYWKTFNYDLIWDDEVFFKHNLLFIENHPLSSAIKFSYFSEQLGVQNQDHYYRPLLTASFLVENKLWGIHPVTLRLTNLIIYILALVFLFFFFKIQSEKNYFAEMATLLFALYPLNTDNIVWIVGRGDLLMLLWGSLTFLFLALFVKKGKHLFLGCSSFFYLLGIFSKETFLLFFPLLIIYELIRRKKVSIPYHLANLFLTFLFFFIKNIILDVKNLEIAYSPTSIDGLKAALGTLGYYFRTMIFPLRYTLFVSLSDVAKVFYLLFGLLAAVFIVYLFSRSKKDKEILFPAAMFVVFLGGHLPLIFTNIYPYQIYSRYMMMAALGLIWLLAKSLTKIKEQPRLYVILVILVLFIPAIVLNAGSYKHKTSFWERARKALPNDAYVLFQSAKVYYENNDFLSTELALNKVLSLTIKRETAIMISLLYADIEMTRADYKNVLKWIDSIEEFERTPSIKIAPFVRYQINAKKAQVYMSQGDMATAEKLLEDNLSKYSTVKEAYSELYNMYISHQLWEKAASLEKMMKEIFPNYYANIDTAQMEAEFEKLPFEKKMSLYIQHRNFPAAIALVKTMPSLDLDHQFLLAKLYYYKGDAEAGEKMIKSILETRPTDYETLNKVGYFYLSNLIRVREALSYFDKSLSLNYDQPQVFLLSQRLKSDYLAKLTEVWK